MHAKLFIAAASIFIIALTITPASTQEPQSSSLIIISEEGSIYRWSAHDDQLTTLPGDLPGGIISPAGTHIAYRFIPQAFQDGLQALIARVGGVGGVSNAYDIGLYDLRTGTTTLVAGQPGNASFFIDGKSDYYFMHSEPAWSPDGTMLAWTRVNYGQPDDNPNQDNFEISIYNLTTGTTSTVTNKLAEEAMYANEGPPAIWTTEGISVVYDFGQRLTTYELDGTLLSDVTFDDPALQFEPPMLPLWHEERQFIAIEGSDYLWRLLDPRTGNIQSADGVPERTNRSAESQTPGIIALERPDQIVNWQWVNSNGQLQPLAFAPEVIDATGNLTAYIEHKGVYLWDQNQVQLIAGTGPAGIRARQLFWEPPAWRLHTGLASSLQSMPKPIQQQVSRSPVILAIAQDLWAWAIQDGVPRRLTNRGDVSSPILSPDGSTIIYRTTVGRFGDSALSTYRDVWMLDVANGTTSVVAQGLDTDNTAVDIVRLSPVWSPDGMQIAWVELVYPARDHRLVRFDLMNGKFAIIATELPYPHTLFDTTTTWSESGLAVISYLGNGECAISLFAADGSLLNTATVLLPNVLYGADWVEDQGREYIGLRHGDGLTLVDSTTGISHLTSGDLEIYSPLAPDTSLAAFIRTTYPRGSWQVDTAQAAGSLTLGVSEFGQPNLAISPDGQGFVYSQYGRALIWQDGQVLQIPSTGTEQGGSKPFVAWGPIAYRIRHDVEMPQAPPESCPDAMPTRLQRGQQAQVISGTGANNVRSQPSTTGTVTGQIPEIQPFTLVDGPRCEGSITWWQVNYNGLVGWTAEGQGNTYFLEPLR